MHPSAPTQRHKHAPTETYRQTRTHARNQAEVGEKTAAQNSELVWSRSKRRIGMLSGGGGELNSVTQPGEGGDGAVETEIESINFKLM